MQVKESVKAFPAVEKRRSESRQDNAFQPLSCSQPRPHKPLHSPQRHRSLLPEALFPGELVASEKQLSLLQVLSICSMDVVSLVVTVSSSGDELLTHRNLIDYYVSKFE